MPAFRDPRDGRWRYRKRITLPDGTRDRIKGTPAIDTRKAAEDAERKHIERKMNPQAVPSSVASAKRKEHIPTIEECAKQFLEGYLPDQKPSESKSKKQILDGHIIPALGHLRLDEIRQSDVDAFVTKELKRVCRKTINNRLAVLVAPEVRAREQTDRSAHDPLSPEAEGSSAGCTHRRGT